MDLARAAAIRARADLAEPEPSTEAPEPPAARPARAAARKPTDPAALFIRLTAAVRQCIALEARLAAGPPAAAGATARERRADPRRSHLQEAFQIVTKHHPDRRDLAREAAARIDDALAADPDQTLQPIEILFDICGELGVEIDLAILPDKYLGPDPGAATHAPCATSPP